MTRTEYTDNYRALYTDNYRALDVAMRRSPVDAAFAGIMALDLAGTLELQARLDVMASKTTGTKIRITVQP